MPSLFQHPCVARELAQCSPTLLSSKTVAPTKSVIELQVKSPVCVLGHANSKDSQGADFTFATSCITGGEVDE